MTWLKWLDGKKTYLAAAAFAVLAAVEYSNGGMTQATAYLSAALAAVGIRHAIAKGGA